MNTYELHQAHLEEQRQKQTSSTPTLIQYVPRCLKPTVNSITRTFNIMSCRPRLLKELRKLEAIDFTLPHIDIIPTDNLHVLYADFTFTDHPLFVNDQKYRMKICLTEKYPFEAPVCFFICNDEFPAVPMNPHVYSNGHICLDLLGPAWTPLHSVESLVISVQSMLVGNTLNERPCDDERYVKAGVKDPTKTKFEYHDDNV